MIVPMKKAQIIMYDKERKNNIKHLKKLGLVHVSIKETKSSEYLENLELQNTIERALALFPADKDFVPDINTNVSLKSAAEYAKRIIQQADELKNKEDELKKLDLVIGELEPWGNFNPDDLQLVASKGVSFDLIKVKKNKLKQIAADESLTLLNSTKQSGYVLATGGIPEWLTDFESFELPESSLATYRNQRENLLKNIQKINDELNSLERYKNYLYSSLKKLDELLEFVSVSDSADPHDQLAVISGFIPAEEAVNLQTYSNHHGWAVLLSDPEEEEPVPTKIKNNKAIRIIQPVFNLMGTVPGYRENDISFMFLLFFSLFFAMIIGDGGYGAIILLGSVFSIIKAKVAKKKVSDALFLFTLMGLTTVIWGAVSGTWFGFEGFARNPVFKWAIIERISSFPATEGQSNNNNIIFFCFAIGIVHIVIAHTWNFIKELKKGTYLKAVAQLGWLSIVSGLYFLILGLVLKINTGAIPVLPMITGGLGVVIIFGEQEGNFGKGIVNGLKGLINTVLDCVGSFSDIISYIRLFAVGLASVEIAKTFNSMAASTGSSIYGIIGGILILALGHTLNLGMGALSVIVHGVRLNMLEFSGHLGMEWSGFEYKPFKEQE